MNTQLLPQLALKSSCLHNSMGMLRMTVNYSQPAAGRRPSSWHTVGGRCACCPLRSRTRLTAVEMHGTKEPSSASIAWYASTTFTHGQCLAVQQHKSSWTELPECAAGATAEFATKHLIWIPWLASGSLPRSRNPPARSCDRGCTKPMINRETLSELALGSLRTFDRTRVMQELP